MGSMVNPTGLEAILRRAEPAVRLVSERHLLQLLNYLADWGEPVVRNASLPQWVRRRDAEAAGNLPQETLHGTEPVLLLITTPDDRLIDHHPLAEQLAVYWRLLFQAAVVREVDSLVAAGRLTCSECQRRLEEWGPLAAREIVHVLQEDHLLPDVPTAETVYRQFAALYAELAMFEPDRVGDYFPSLSDIAAVRSVLERDCDWEVLWQRTRPENIPSMPPLTATLPAAAGPPSWPSATPTNHPAGWYDQHVDRETDHSHTLASAAAIGPHGLGDQTCEGVPRPGAKPFPTAITSVSLQQLVAELASIWRWDAATAAQWLEMLRPMVALAARGRRVRAARCLRELQRIAAEKEEDLYVVDVIEVICSAGRKPLKRRLPFSQQVRRLLRLKKAHRHMLRAGLPPADHQRLDALFHLQIEHTTEELHAQLAPVIEQGLIQAGLVPHHAVEVAGRDKLVAELIDQICERGYIRFGDLRDAIARNQLKLQDISGIIEWLRGDSLLRADRILSERLDGIYRRGEIYLRALQRFSSVLFGTPWGRAITLYLAVPFGGAFLILMFLEELRHLSLKAARLFAPPQQVQLVEGPPPSLEPPVDEIDAEHHLPIAPPPRVWLTDPEWTDEWSIEDWDQEPPTPVAESNISTPEGERSILWYGSDRGSDLVTGVLRSTAAVDEAAHAEPSFLVSPWTIAATGLFFLLLLHWPRFRSAVWLGCVQIGTGLRLVLWEWPRRLWRSPWVRTFLQSRPVRFLYRHLATPLLLTLLCYAILILVGINPLFLFDWLWVLILVSLTIAYNTPWGWMIQDRIAEAIADGWRRIRVNLIPGLIAVFIDWFHRLANWIEAGLHAVDEWLQCRRQESWVTLTAKALLGVVWFPIEYALRFVFYLLVEPQVNPVKHFPVVTVSHKVIWPLVPQLSAWTGISLWTMGMIINGIPGIFGFIAWEFKENWRLYAANRPRRLQPVRIGSHGETLRRLLCPGFHSGTLPRLYRKLRRANQLQQQILYRYQLQHVAEELRRFFEREPLRMLRFASYIPACKHFRIREIRIGCRWVQVVVSSGQDAELRWELTVEDIGGQVTAEAAAAGWPHLWPEPVRPIMLLTWRGLLDLAAVQVYAGTARGELAAAAVSDLKLRPQLCRTVSWEEWVTGWDTIAFPPETSGSTATPPAARGLLNH